MLPDNKTHFMSLWKKINLIINHLEMNTCAVRCINITQNIKFILIKILIIKHLHYFNIF
jgi:hypothetical protein